MLVIIAASIALGATIGKTYQQQATAIKVLKMTDGVSSTVGEMESMKKGADMALEIAKKTMLDLVEKNQPQQGGMPEMVPMSGAMFAKMMGGEATDEGEGPVEGELPGYA